LWNDVIRYLSCQLNFAIASCNTQEDNYAICHRLYFYVMYVTHVIRNWIFYNLIYGVPIHRLETYFIYI